MVADGFVENDDLLHECIQALDAKILSVEEDLKISTVFKSICPFRGWHWTNLEKYNKKTEEFRSQYSILLWGKVDWDRFDKKIDIGFDPQNIEVALEELYGRPVDTSVYIEWNDMSLPVLQAQLEDIIENFNDVVCVSFESFFFNLNVGYVIEVLPSGQITAGIFPTSDKFLISPKEIDYSNLQSNIVFQECVNALGTTLLPKDEEKYLDAWFRKMCPVTKWGRINWDKFDKKVEVGYEPKNIKRVLGKLLQAKGPFDKTAYIEWSEVGLPVIKTNLDDIIGKFDDIAAVSFEKFIFNPTLGYVIEVLHSGQMTIGLIPSER